MNDENKIRNIHLGRIATAIEEKNEILKSINEELIKINRSDGD